MPQYGEADYWEARYTREPSTFDWYQGYRGLRHVLHAYFPLESKLLHVGVGTSRLQEDMVRNGFQHIVNVDYSKAAIAHMKELHKSIPQLTYQVSDVRDMPEFADTSFDGVIDKGTLDALLCGEKSDDSSVDMLFSISRVLVPGGTFMMVTYGEPSSRLDYLMQPEYGWTVDVFVVTKPDSQENLGSFNDRGDCVCKGPYKATNQDMMDSLSALDNVHYVYCCTKLGGGSEGSDQDTMSHLDV